MILHCDFEELRALSSGAEVVLHETVRSGEGSVAAPAEAAALVEQLIPHLSGDLSIATLTEQRRLHTAISFICEGLHARMEEKILEYHPAHEEATLLYFDYAHTRTVLDRLERMGAEMEAIALLIAGDEASPQTIGATSFPD